MTCSYLPTEESQAKKYVRAYCKLTNTPGHHLQTKYIGGNSILMNIQLTDISNKQMALVFDCFCLVLIFFQDNETTARIG